MAFLTRYNTALLIIPIILYILINKDEIKNFKNILIGIFASILLLIPFLTFFYEKFGNILYPFISTVSTTISYSSPEGYYYDPNLLYYIERFPIHTGFEGLLILFIILLMFVIYLIITFKSNYKKKLSSEWNIEKTGTKLKLLLFLFLTIIFIGTFGQITYMITEVIFFGMILLFYDLTKHFKIKSMDIYLLVFAWYMVFFIFNSIYVIKTDRYFVLMAPAVAFFLVLGLSELSNRLPFKFKKKNITFPLLAVIITVIILLSTMMFLPIIKEQSDDYKVSNEQVTLISEWFTTYDPNYRNEIEFTPIYGLISHGL